MTMSTAGERVVSPETPGTQEVVAEVRSRSRYRRPLTWTADMGRYLAARTLVGIADILPRGGAVAVVRTLAFFETALSSRGRSARAEARDVMRVTGRKAAFRMAWSWISVPYIDLVDLRRVSRHREDLTQWTLEEVNREPAYALLDARKPILGVGGHFSFAGLLPLAHRFPNISPTGALDPIEPFALRGDVLLRRLMMGMAHGLSEVLLPGRVTRSYVGQSNVQDDLLATLSRPDGVGFIMIDIDWKRAWAFHRPFCGYADRGFALGATRIARLAQVPIVMVVSERVGPRRTRVYFSDPVWPGPVDRPEDDEPLMSRLLDDLERQIGRLRHAYPHPVGWARRWNPETERWEPRENA